MIPPSLRRSAIRIGKIALAGTLAWWLARAAGAERPVFATLVPLVSIKDDPFSALNLSASRLVGVLAGVGVGTVVVATLGASTAAIAVLLVVGLALGSVIRLGTELNTQIAVSALLLLVAADHAERYAVERIWETAIGVAVAVAVAALILPPDPVGAIEHELERTTELLRADLAHVGAVLERGSEAATRRFLADTSDHARTAVRATDDIERARRALAFNPRRRSAEPQLDALAPRVELNGRIAIQLRRFARDANSFGARADLRETWLRAGAHLPAIAAQIASALPLALPSPVALELLERYRQADPHPVSAILRRSFVLMLEDLATFSTSEAGTPHPERATVSKL